LWTALSFAIWTSLVFFIRSVLKTHFAALDWEGGFATVAGICLSWHLLLHTYLHIITYHLHRCSDMSTHFRPASAHIITPHLHTSSHIFCTHMCAHTHITTHLLVIDRSFSQIFTYLHASCHAFAHHLGPSAHLPVTSSSTDTAQRIFLANDAGHCCIGETGSTDANRVEHVTKGYPPDFVVSLVKCMWNAGFGGV
jgi:hypothetical protein